MFDFHFEEVNLVLQVFDVLILKWVRILPQCMSVWCGRGHRSRQRRGASSGQLSAYTIPIIESYIPSLLKKMSHGSINIYVYEQIGIYIMLDA